MVRLQYNCHLWRNIKIDYSIFYYNVAIFAYLKIELYMLRQPNKNLFKSRTPRFARHGRAGPGCCNMAGGFDNDFVSSHPVLLPDPPELNRESEIPLESLGEK
jgi:hypothetical protein